MHGRERELPGLATPMKKDIANLDNVQKFAGRTVTRNWSMSKTELQSKLNWQPLQTRRRNIKLKIVYNITNKLSRLPPTVFINHPSPSPRHPHNKILFQPYVSTLSHRHSFFIDVIPIWNSLSLTVLPPMFSNPIYVPIVKLSPFCHPILTLCMFVLWEDFNTSFSAICPTTMQMH